MYLYKCYKIEIEKKASISNNDFRPHFACCDVVWNYINSLAHFLPVIVSCLPVFRKKSSEAIYMPENNNIGIITKMKDHAIVIIFLICALAIWLWPAVPPALVFGLPSSEFVGHEITLERPNFGLYVEEN